MQQQYSADVVGVNATITIHGNSIGGFLAKTAGTVTVTAADGTVVVNAQPVAAGTWVDMPFYVGPNGGTFTTAGGASGTLAVG